MTTPWMLDELAHAGPEHLDPDFAAGFEIMTAAFSGSVYGAYTCRKR